MLHFYCGFDVICSHLLHMLEPSVEFSNKVVISCLHLHPHHGKHCTHSATAMKYNINYHEKYWIMDLDKNVNPEH